MCVCRYGQKCLEGCENLCKFLIHSCLSSTCHLRTKITNLDYSDHPALSESSTMPCKASVDIVSPQPCASASVGTLPRACPQPWLITASCYDLDPLLPFFHTYLSSDSYLSWPCTCIPRLSSFWLLSLTTVYFISRLLHHDSHLPLSQKHIYRPRYLL